MRFGEEVMLRVWGVGCGRRYLDGIEVSDSNFQEW